VKENFGDNLFSLYDPASARPFFQYDANGAYPGAVMVGPRDRFCSPILTFLSSQNALIQAPDVANFSIPLVITLLPAVPKAWGAGYLNGARLRGGIRADVSWSNGNVHATLSFDRSRFSRCVQIVYRGKVVKTAIGVPKQVVVYSS
jgi:alpha-L-fucosidase 2